MYNPIPRPFASARLRARIVIALLAAGILIALLSLFATVGETFLPTTDIEQLGENPIGLALVLATFLLLLIQIVVFLTTAVFFLTFLYRAHENLPALGTPKNQLQYSSGWMVGSFFVPFASLVIPYRAVKELWQRSQPIPDNVPGVFGYQSDPPAYFALWWLFWILSNIANNVLYRIGDLPGQNALPIPWLAALVHALEIGSAAFLMLVVISIDKRQAEARAMMVPERFAGPPPPPQFGPIQNQNSPSWP